jgi:hypothetical protein
MYSIAAKIAAPVLNGQIECPKDMADLFEVARCKLGQEATDIARKKVDEKILCELFCCCLNTGGNQACVEEALTTADKETNYKARYKAEVSYNMQFEPPRPMMEKDQHRELTTEPIPRSDYGHLSGRAEIEYDPALRRPAGEGGYRFRRPDVVIVKDPSIPPHKSNISQVIEMKFPGDSLKSDQRRDYERIGGPRKLRIYHSDDPCKCGEGERVPVPVPIPVPVPAPKEVPALVPVPAPKEVMRPVPVRPGPTAGDWAILIGLGIATVGLALLPVDGPVGEAAAGTATAAQWARMFGAAAAL